MFAEAGKDFVDTLFSFLTLPLGTVVKLLGDEKLDSIGSLSSLYQGLEKFDAKYFWTGQYCKNMLLKPINSSEDECWMLKVNMDDPAEYLICEESNCTEYGKASSCDYSRHENAVCNCGKPLKRESIYTPYSIGNKDVESGVFVTETSFIVSDDLRIMPDLLSYSFQMLNTAGIKDKKVVVEKTLKFGFKEFVYLLQCTVSSSTPLTDFTFRKKPYNPKTEMWLPRTITTSTSSSRMMSLKLVVLKSKKKVLFAQAEEDFVDFIFGFLTIPLGQVSNLLGVNTFLGCLDNLSRSVLDLTVGRHLKSDAHKDMLINPQFAPLHLCKNQIVYHYSKASIPPRLQCRNPLDTRTIPMFLKDTKFEGGFVKGPGLFRVTDDLVVTNLSSIAAFNYLSDMSISVCDVEEQVVSIGIDEALSILKASLHYKSALTNGLAYLLIKPKEES